MSGVILSLTICLSRFKCTSQAIGDSAEPITGKGTKGNFFGFFEFHRSKKEISGSNKVFTLTPTSSNAMDASRMAPEASRTTTILADTTCVILEVLIYVYRTHDYIHVLNICTYLSCVHIGTCTFRYISILIYIYDDLLWLRMSTYFDQVHYSCVSALQLRESNMDTQPSRNVQPQTQVTPVVALRCALCTCLRCLRAWIAQSWKTVSCNQ